MRKFIVTIEGKQYEVGVEEVGGGSAPIAPVVTAVSAPVSAPVASAPAVVNGTKMEAPMPGMIKAYKVAEGATVKKGDVILILEAMKMDNDIIAEIDGKITYQVTKGSNVETDAVMAVIS